MADPGVDPDQVALRELRIANAGWERDVTGCGRWPARAVARNGVEDRVDQVGVPTQFMQPTQERSRDFGAVHARDARGVGRIHGLFVQSLCVFDARELVVGFGQAGRPEHSAGVNQVGGSQAISLMFFTVKETQSGTFS